MSKKVHRFKQSQKIGSIGEHTIKKYLENYYEIVYDLTKQPELYKHDVDYLCITNTCKAEFIEVKTDTYTGKNNKIFIETISNTNTNKPGWIDATKADYVFYYAANTPHCYALPKFWLQPLKKIAKKHGTKKEVWNPNYNSIGYTLNIDKIPKPWYVKIDLTKKQS